MTLDYLQVKIQGEINALLKGQRDLRLIHDKMEDRIFSSSLGQHVDRKLYSEKLSICLDQIEQIEALEERCGRITRKFIEMKIQRRSNNQNNLNR